jgi:hypothetical protein
MPPFFVSFSLSLVAPPLPPSLSLSFVFYLAFLCCRLLCCLLPGPQVRQGFGSGCWLPLGSAMGTRCACRGEAGVVRGGRVANGRGGHGPSCLRRIMCFCPGVFCQGFRWGKGLQIELLIALCECHGAEVRVSR